MLTMTLCSIRARKALLRSGRESKGELPKNARYINLGDWIEYNTYAVFDGDKLTLTTWDD
mgnify:CR=1 FL=1